MSPTPDEPMSTLKAHLQVAPAASAFLDLMVDLGHLDDRALEEVNDRLLDQASPDEQLGLDEVRRVIATVIFGAQDRLDGEQGRILDSEWGLLFS